MTDKKKILKRYWGYPSFRNDQGEIIDELNLGNNVIALLPTGGGKSLCYQIPALMKPGICLVISPLRALIRDQIKELSNKGIKALNLSEGSGQQDLLRILDNAEFGSFKFIFSSPEKLQNSIVKQRLKSLKVSLIAIDEAHCISAWGHDFRTDFNKLGELTELFEDIPVIALTATATPVVLDDIKKVLNLDALKTRLFKTSLNRPNLACRVSYSLNTMQEIFKRLNQADGLGIIYTGSRAKTKEIAVQLGEMGIKAGAFHGGMSEEHKSNVLEAWDQNDLKVMVSTNAFGMGINKSNVEIVIHFDIPPNMENYVQEVGRAGRGGQTAYGWLVADSESIKKFKFRYIENALTQEDVRLYYLKICQYLGIAYGELLDFQYPMQLAGFTKQYGFNQNKVYTGLKLLENLGVLKLREHKNDRIKVQFKQSNTAVYSFLDHNNSFKPLLELLLRSYEGIFEEPVYIETKQLIKRLAWNKAYLINQFKKIEQLELIFFEYENTDLSIEFLKPREDDYTINAVSEALDQQLKIKKQKSQDFLRYIDQEEICRAKMVLDYFEQDLNEDCGKCDVCLSKIKPTLNLEDVLNFIDSNPHSTLENICSKLNMETSHILKAISRLLEQEKIEQNKDFTFVLKKNKG